MTRPAWMGLLWLAVEDAVMFREPPATRAEFDRELDEYWREAEKRNEEYAAAEGSAAKEGK